MVDFQLYIENEKVDLFKDESIQVTDKIQDIKDISKIFTTYTSQFSLPATQKNNNIFRHYYNYDIVNGYDARIKKEAIIKLNGFDRYRGYIQLNKVALKDNKPNSYKVFFTGQTAKIKEILKNKELKDLDYLSNYDHAYNNTNIKNGIEGSLFGGVIKYPFISSEARLVESIGDLLRVNDDNEITSTRAKANEDFKPAIQIYEIIKAIEDQYTELQFDSDFFETDTFKEIYMWLHRNKGKAKVDFASFAYNRDTLNNVTGDPLTYPIDGVFRIIEDPDNINPTVETDFINIQTYDKITLDYEVTVDGDFSYEVYNRTNDTLITSGIGSSSSSETFQLVLENQGIYEPEVIVSTDDDSATLMTVDLAIECIDDYVDQQDGIQKQIIRNSTWSRTFSTVTNFVIQQQTPKIKIIDFLTSLFKMFNLTAYVQQDNTIKIEPLDDYFNAGNIYDITKYVDISQSDVERVDTFYQLNFSFKEPKTIYREEVSDEVGKIYGDLEYNISQDLANVNELASTEEYDIKVGFNKMYYVRLLDESGNSQGVNYGACVDKDGKPTSIEPLLLYLENTSLASSLSIDPASTGGGGSLVINSVNEPYNYREIAPRVFETLNFGIEIIDIRDADTSSLFQNYYSNYVRRNFNRQSRLFAITAYLDYDFLLNYNLNDIVIINNRRFRINSINVNLSTKKAKLTLQNEVL